LYITPKYSNLQIIRQVLKIAPRQLALHLKKC
jgi:hypothetical protein